MNDIRAKILWWAADRRLRQDKPYLIAVTGTIAKTSTKEALGTILREAYGADVRVGFGNLNSYLGVPLAILGYEIDFFKQQITWQWLPILIGAICRGLFARLPKYLLIELGVDKPKDMQMLTKFVRPDISVMTLVTSAHLENFESLEDYVSEKLLLAKATKPSGMIVINSTDPNLEKIEKSTKAKSYEVSCDNSEIAVSFARQVATLLKIDEATMQKSLDSWNGISGRMQTIKTDKVTLIDDSYNANPSSMKGAFEVLAKAKTRKVAIIGEMKELGEITDQSHQEVGKQAGKVADLVIAVGGEPAKLFAGDHYYQSSDEALNYIFKYLCEGDTILVKGSHSLHMDKLVTAIKEKYQ